MYSLIAGFFVGFVIGFVANVINATKEAQLSVSIGGYLVFIPASMLAIKQAFEKHLPSLRHEAPAVS